MRTECTLNPAEPVALTDGPQAAGSPRGWSTLRFAWVLIGLVVAAYPDVVLGGRTFFFRDFGYFGYPLAHYFRNSLLAGHWPLWNPFNNCGLPFLAQWITMVLYPPMWLCLLLPLWWILPVLNLAHMVWGGIGMHALTASRSSGSWGPVLAGVAFAFSGFTVNCLMWPCHAAALAWVPWVILTVEKGWRQGGRALWTAAICGGFQMLSGGVEIILLTWVLAASMWLGGFLFGQVERRSAFGRALLLLGLVCGLTAVQLWPFFQLLLASHRSSGFANDSWSMPVSGWINFLVPLFHTTKLNQGVHFLEGQAWTTSYYVGLGTVIAAAFGLIRQRSKENWWWGAVALGGLILAWGDAGVVYAMLRSCLPILGFMRYPIKFVVLTTFALSLIAGRTLSRFESLAEDRRRQEARWWIWIAALTGVVIVGVLIHGEEEAAQQSALLGNGLVRLILLAAMVAAVWAGWLSRSVKRPWVGRVALVLVFWVDLATHTPCQNPTAEPWIYRAEATQGFLPEDPRPEPGVSRAMLSSEGKEKLRSSWLEDPEDMYVSRRTAMLHNCNLVDNVAKVDGFFPLYPASHVEVLSEVCARDPEKVAGLLDFMGVSHITRAGTLFDWEKRSTFRPLFSVGQTPKFLDEPAILKTILSSDFDPARTVCLPVEAKEESAGVGTGIIGATEITAHRLGVTVKAESSCWVTIAQTWYPCWRARLDGQPVHLWRANHAFQAVAIPSGQHRLELVYKDQAFAWGGCVSAATWLSCVVGWKRSGRRGMALE